MDTFKPRKYAPTPVFNPNTQYISMKDPVDMGDYIFIDFEIHNIPENIENNLIINSIQIEDNEKSLDELKKEKIIISKLLLEDYLDTHPLKYADENYYSVSEKHQNRLNSAISAYNLELALGFDDAELKWNTTGNVCKKWKLKDLGILAVMMKRYVQPLVERQQTLEIKIKNSKSERELDRIVITYDTTH